MVNLLGDDNVSCLLQPSLQPRHFPEIDLSKRQLQVWSNKAGIAALQRPNTRTRRIYSPFEVLALFTLKCLRVRVGADLLEEDFLLQFLSNKEKFLFPALRDWSNGGTPCLATDFKQHAWIATAREGLLSIPAQDDGTVSVAMALCVPIQATLLSIGRGGNARQREIALLATGHRTALLPTSDQNKSQQIQDLTDVNGSPQKWRDVVLE